MTVPVAGGEADPMVARLTQMIEDAEAQLGWTTSATSYVSQKDAAHLRGVLDGLHSALRAAAALRSTDRVADACGTMLQQLARQEIDALDANNRTLRKLLWLAHGCGPHALYGDDGEMQCNVCRADFKRMSVAEIEQTFRARAIRQMEPATPTDSQQAAAADATGVSASKIAAEVVQSIADDEPDDDAIEAMELLRGTPYESMFVLHGARIEQAVRVAIENAQTDAALQATFDGVPPSGIQEAVDSIERTIGNLHSISRDVTPFSQKLSGNILYEAVHLRDVITRLSAPAVAVPAEQEVQNG